jgi:hypothetical protein
MNRMNPIAALVLLLGAAAAMSPLQAQTVWRCGADGRSFSDRPCADGQRLQMAELADMRSAGEVAAAQAVAARQQRLAEALRQERLQRERASTPAFDRHVLPQGRQGSAGIKPKREAKMQQDEAPRPPRHRSQAQPQRPAAPQPAAADGIWRAVAPASPRTPD